MAGILSFLFLLKFFEVRVESLVAMLPISTERFGPLGHLLQRLRFELTRSPLRFARLRDEPCFAQHLQMFGDRG